MTNERPRAGLEPVPEEARNSPGGGSLVDHTVTLLLFVPFGFAAIALFQIGALVGMQADVCGSDGYVCNYSTVDLGALTARYAPLGLLILAILAAVHRMVRQRIAFWIPLTGIAAVIGVVLLADALVSSAITHT